MNTLAQLGATSKFISPCQLSSRIIEPSVSEEPFLVCELADGTLTELDKKAEKQPRSPARKILKANVDCLFWQLMSAVHHLHQKGIAHRDIKPGNLSSRSTDWTSSYQVSLSS